VYPIPTWSVISGEGTVLLDPWKEEVWQEWKWNEVKRTSGGPASCHGRSLERPQKVSPPSDENTCVPRNAVCDGPAA
jgi:hypothetical protein